MSCPDYEYIERYIGGKLDGNEKAKFETHLNQCRECDLKLKEARANEELLCRLRQFHTIDASISSDTNAEITEKVTVELAQKLLGPQYQVTEKIGHGSAGEVFKAVDTILDRPAAVKFLNKKYSADSTDEQRWREARLVSQLNHPNITQIYHIGEQDGVRFIVMEWVNGVSLTEAFKGKSIEQRLSIYVQLLDAIAAAHKRGIIHRDIKPLNILVNCDSQVKVLDFGIAVDAQFHQTANDSCYRGTPAFSAPEQITAPVKITKATDVFALGVVLYQLLTDLLPFPQTDPKELFNAIRTQHPELPSAVEEKVPIALQNICLKALEKNPDRRYPDACAMSDDIGRYLRGEKVWSRPSFLTDKCFPSAEMAQFSTFS